ncbi:acyltransferase family protein [Mycolicibacterium pulveris]|uniref:acyltransferase family protein n=1 Tax=Mycolicibacterium pulveris TaxID=36813 RepID=UPI003CF82B82
MPPTDDSVPAATGRPAGTRFRADIEGLRAVAVLAVVLFHADVPGLDGGFIGVDVFFVISGFLITGMLWREVNASGTVRLGRFYGARARRLLPASAAVAIVTMIGAAVLLPPLQSAPVFDDGVASALYVGNIWLFLAKADYFSPDTPSPFLHYWSLAVEEQFYLVWPILLIGVAWLIRRRGRRVDTHARSSHKPYLLVLVLIAVTSFAASLVLTYVMPMAAFFMMPTRAWQLALGGLLALTVAQWHRLPPVLAMVGGWLGLGVILLACTWFSPITPYPGTAALLPVVGAVLIIGAGCAVPDRGVGRALSLRPMRAVGRISYSWYLWHWPLLILAPAALGHPLGLTGRLAAVFISAGLAVLTLHLIENPVRFAPPIQQSAARSIALGAAATVVAVVVGVALIHFTPQPVGRGPAVPTLSVRAMPAPPGAHPDLYDAAVRDALAQVQAAVAASADRNSVPSNLAPALADARAEQTAFLLGGCMRLIVEVGHPECTSGDTSSTTTVALVGDSNAAMWNSAFQQLAAQRHWRLETLTKAGCPLLDQPIFEARLNREYTECQQWRGQIIDRLRIERLRAERPRLIVLSMSRQYNIENGFPSYGPAWFDSLTRLVRELRDIAPHVLVLGPIPDPGSDVPVCLSAHLDDVVACSPPRSTAVNAEGIAAETAAITAAGGQYADLTDMFCTTDRCPVIVGNTLLYMDKSHLTLEYTRQVAPVIGALVDRALISG